MTTLTDLIKSAERKIADPTTTPQTVEREKAIAHYLTAMQAENEIKDEALAAYRTENNELLLRLDRMEKVISEVQSENAELYVALCESGDMARERSRRKPEIVEVPETQGFYSDRQEVFMTYHGNELLRKAFVDKLIRHKWPEEKPVYDPENPKKYLVLDCTFEKASYHPDGYFWTFDCGQEYILEDVSYWWNLPEVTE